MNPFEECIHSVDELDVIDSIIDEVCESNVMARADEVGEAVVTTS
jgi:hypothetical protein